MSIQKSVLSFSCEYILLLYLVATIQCTLLSYIFVHEILICIIFFSLSTDQRRNSGRVWSNQADTPSARPVNMQCVRDTPSPGPVGPT